MPTMLTKEALAQFIDEHVDKSTAALRAELAEVEEKRLTSEKAGPPEWMKQFLMAQTRSADGGSDPESLWAGPRKFEKGIIAAGVIRAIAATKGDHEKAQAFVGKHWKEKDPAFADAVTKALAAGDNVAGGFLVPTPLSQDIIELLRPQSVMRRMGTTTLPMPMGSIRIPKITAGSAASYIGENQNIPKTQPSFGQIVLTYKKLAALVPVSNDLLRYSSPGADAIVRNDLVRAMAQREDQAFLRDDGMAGTPRGLRYQAAAANIIPSVGTWATLANITTDLGVAVQTLKDQNIPMTRPGWLMAPRTERILMTAQNANGFYVFRAEMLAGKLWGIPYATTTQIPTNLAGAGGGSELYLADFDDLIIGESQNLIIDASTDAAYDDNGTVRAAFSLDQTVIRAIAEHDFAARRGESIVVITGIIP